MHSITKATHVRRCGYGGGPLNFWTGNELLLGIVSQSVVFVNEFDSFPPQKWGLIGSGSPLRTRALSHASALSDVIREVDR